MTHLQLILDRLIIENLHGPIATTTTSHTLQPELYGAQEPTQEHGLDSEDPRWVDLFIEYFLDNSDSKNDDLLFFVRKQNSDNEHLDPVFVKRKSAPRVMPQLDDPVLWKETFFLNLIVQLPCKLTVAVCTRTQINPSSGGVGGGDGGETEQKTSMTCSRKHVSKRVYALPTKSRMDIKEASMECSYPLIYYVIDDYEDMFEHLIVNQGEHLCVELAVTLPNKLDDDDDFSNESDDGYYNNNNNTNNNSHNKKNNNHHHNHNNQNNHNNHHRRSLTNEPFPQQNDTKITLFQGAASYSALLNIYKQKTESKISRRFKIGPVSPSTEYIMMRGPGGKGHAQVAITAISLEESNGDDFFDIMNPSSFISSFNSSNSTNNNNNNNNNNNLTDIKIQNNGKTSMSNGKNNNNNNNNNRNSFFQSLKRLSQSISDKSFSDPESLKCCMTFVNVPWTSIIADLTTYARKKQQS